MDEYILFVDETMAAPKNPYFCFAGLIIKRSEYEDVLVPEINALKKKYFNSECIIFHYTDMKNNKGEFSVLTDLTFRNKFWTEFVNILKKIMFYTIGVYFNQNLMKELYKDCKTPYFDVAYRNLVENYMHFLITHKGIGSVCVESRLFRENAYLEQNHFDYIQRGSIYYSNELISKHLTTVGFIVKGDNCVGLQIADIIPARFVRMKNNLSDNYLMNELFHEKMYCYGTNKEEILGLKNLL